MKAKGLFRALLLLLLAVALVYAYRHWRTADAPGTAAGDAAIRAAYQEQRSGFMVEAAGSVERILSDDVEGSRHQRFILRLDGGQTLLISHNIDLAPRVPLAEGDRIEFFGQYEWNERGGVIHWTHHDPDGSHPGGWIRHRGEQYE